MAVEMSLHHFSICQEANGQFYDVNTHFQPLTNHPASQLYTPKMHIAFWQDVHYK